MKTINCVAIIRQYLEENGYDGLCAPDNECGCSLDDFMPCGGDYAILCEAGYKIDCPESCGEGCDFHIVARKRESE